MGLPSKKRPSSEKFRRASHFALRKPTLSSCKKCGKPVRPHHVCANCGTYNGRQVIAKNSKAEKKLKQRAAQRKKTEKAEKAAQEPS